MSSDNDQVGTGGAQRAAERTDRETTYHPALSAPASRGMAAGKALIVVLVALLVAGLLNSNWMVHTAEGMRPGLGRTVVHAVAVPFDVVGSALALDRPRQQLDLLLGREPVTVDSGEIEVDTVSAPVVDSATLAKPGVITPPPPPVYPPRVAPAKVAHPTAAKPLSVLVIGDSLTTYTGNRLAELFAHQKIAKSKVIWRDGTGLATPQFFNWATWALSTIEKEKPDAVVVILGGNDNQDMQRQSAYFPRGTDAWQKEYQRRVSVVTQAMINRGVDRVYWSGPPTARNSHDNDLYHQLNVAVSNATTGIKGAHFVDLAGPTAQDGQWVDTLVFGNDAFRARMGDNFHWSWKAAQITSKLVSDAMGRDYGPLS